MVRIARSVLAIATILSCSSNTAPDSNNTAPEEAKVSPRVSLSFDDGYESAYKNGLPILDKYGYKATWYIISSRIGGATYMTKQEMLNLQSAGHEIGGHTLSHFHLDTATDAEASKDIKAGRDGLLSMGVHEVNTFAYPFGAYNSRTPALVKDVGFSSARTVDDGENTIKTEPYHLHSTSLNPNSTIAYVQALVDKSIHDNTWLILTFHRVDEDGNSISVRHEFLEDVCKYLKAKNVPVETVTQAFHNLRQ
jgi:peptidoglycan/xylan/chitin deacetylase (PgdA/CDA1 family)